MSDWLSRAQEIKLPDLPNAAAMAVPDYQDPDHLADIQIEGYSPQHVTTQGDWLSRATPVQDITPQIAANPLQQAFKTKKTGITDRIAEDYIIRANKAQDITNLQTAGALGPFESTVYRSLNAAALPVDAVSEAFKTIATPIGNAVSFIDDLKTPDGLPTTKDMLRDGYSAIANSPVGQMASNAVQGIQNYRQDHPVASTRIGAALDLGNIASAFAPVNNGKSVASSLVESTAKPLALVGEKAYAKTALGSDQQVLQDLGVRMTSGQRSGGVVRSTENSLTSVPIVGDAIKGAYSRSIDDFNRAVTDQVLSPLGQRLPKNVTTGRQAVAYAYDRIRDSYDTILSQMTGTLDNQLNTDWHDIITRARTNLPPEKAEQVVKKIKNAIDFRLSGNQIKGGDNKQIMRRLKTDATKYSKSLDPDQQLMGEIFQDMHTAYSDMLQRNNSADLAQGLKDTDLSFAKYVRLEQASATQGARDGIFTPSQLLGAVKKTDGSVRKGAFARGDALLQDIAEAGNNVLPNTIPDSGSAGRILTGIAAAGVTGATVPITAPILAGGAFGAAAYTRPGQAIIRGTSKLLRKK